jgi:mono/diheme cytochrome c family protein
MGAIILSEGWASCGLRSTEGKIRGSGMANAKGPDLRRHLPSTAFVLILLLGIAGLAGAFIYTGLYNIGADAPHSRFVYASLDRLRERAIAHHSRGIVAPRDLNDPKRISAGAGLYGEMCSGCHLGPGLEKSEISQGLYPPAPELARGTGRTPAQQFWIIKHGVKLSAMPAWGRTHNDELIWDLVAFINTLPKLTPAQYQAALESAPADHEEMMEKMGHEAKTGNAIGQSAAEHAHHEHKH